LPQGISVATPMKLGQDGYFEHCSIQGTWKKVDASTLEISYGPHREEVHVSVVYDREREVETIGLCGIRRDGVSFWAKKVSE
ncbi:MAG: hypothetical protein K6G04_07740, partial [Lachnospiraceae bacterium]|nr:hypothetical protein [Lachnospiraceae bacterium]